MLEVPNRLGGKAVNSILKCLRLVLISYSLFMSSFWPLRVRTLCRAYIVFGPLC